MNSLKILFFNWRCWLSPDAGGAEVFTREVSKRWVESGHEVTLFTSEFPGCKREEIVNGVRIVRAGGRFTVYGCAKRTYRKRFRSENFDLIVDEINTRPFFAQKFADNREKVVALIHQLAREYWFYETPFPISYVGYHYLESRWLRNYVDVPTVTVSESTKKDLLDLGFRRVLVVPEGLNFQPSDKAPEKESFPVIVFVGRLKRAKRPDHAIRAFKTIRERTRDAQLWIIGEGYLRKDLEEMAGNGVRFFSGLGDADRRERIKRAWILTNPSVREGYGLNVVEAAALGTPCVAYNVPGLRDSIDDGITGLLAEAGNTRDLADKMMMILDDVSFRETLSSNALKHARKFSWDTTAREFMEYSEKSFLQPMKAFDEQYV